MATQLQKYKATLVKVVSSPEFLEGMMGMLDDIMRNDGPDDVVTPFFKQSDLLAIGDFYTDQVVMGEITSCFINRTSKFLLQQAGLDVFNPKVFGTLVKVKDELKPLETKLRDRSIALCVKKYGPPKKINKDILDKLIERMRVAEAQFEKDAGDSDLH